MSHAQLTWIGADMAGKRKNFRVPMRSFLRPLKLFDFRSIATLLALAVCIHGNGAEANVLERYQQTSWKTEQGLPHNTIKTIVQTDDGYLWFGTRFGLVRFDGVSFRVFDRANTPELLDDNCRLLAKDQEGFLWAEGNNKLIQLKEGRFVFHQAGGNSTAERIWKISACSQGGIWLATEQGLKRFSNGRLTHCNAQPELGNKDVRTLYEDPHRVLWVGTGNGLYKLDPDSPNFVEVRLDDGSSFQWVSCITQDRLGQLWVGTTSQGLKCWNGAKWTTYGADNGLFAQGITFLVEDRNGSLWIGTGNGALRCFHDGLLESLSTSGEFGTGEVLCLYEDREGNLWIGTAFSGLKRLQPKRITTYNRKDGLIDDNVWSIAPSSDGSLWLGADAGISRFKNNKFDSYPLRPSIPDHTGKLSSEVKCVYEDRNGDLWVGSKRSGLQQFFEGNWKAHHLSGDVRHDEVSVVYQDRTGSLWVGTRGALFLRQGNQFAPYASKNGVSPAKVRALHEDQKGNLWIGTYGQGLHRLRDGIIDSFSTPQGLSDNYVWAIHEEAEGALWFGTENGLNRYQNGRFAALTTREGLFDNVVNSILEDSQTNLWISCNRGIYRIRKQEAHAVAEGRADRLHFVSYGTSDGMLSSETNGENQPAACKTREGHLWFPTTRGVVKIDPASLYLNELPPPVVIEEIITDQELMNPSSSNTLPPGRGRVIEIHYTANSFVAPEKVQFRYRLEGHDSRWVEAGARRVAYYTNLRPGPYRFQVTACNNHGIWNETGASLAFYLAPHFYQTYPFYAVCAFVPIAIGFAIHRLRVRVIKKIQRLEKQAALDSERARIAREMHDDLGASLTQIGLLSELADRDLGQPQKVQTHVRKIGATAGELFRSMDEIVWALNPKHDSLASFIDYTCKYAEKYLRVAGIRCRLEVPGSVPQRPLLSDERHHLFLSVKEALNNVAKHAAASEVWLRIRLHPSELEISIEDNGRGFSMAEIDRSRNGLANMQERLQNLGGQFKIDTQPNSGTRLTFRIVLKIREDGSSG
jgi:ligand-binding sensor domain-containing protein/signal transduction histidine kinase